MVADIFAISLDGVLNTAPPAIPGMQRRGKGQPAIISSMAAFRRLPVAGAYGDFALRALSILRHFATLR